MSQKLFVGSLSYKIDSVELENIFAAVGSVISAVVITDRETGRSKGFGFVEMGSPEEASKAIEQLDGSIQQGRAIVVSLAKPQGERSGGAGGRPHNGPKRGGFGGGAGGRRFDGGDRKDRF